MCVCIYILASPSACYMFKTFIKIGYFIPVVRTLWLSATPSPSHPVSITFFVELKCFGDSIEAPLLLLLDHLLWCGILRR